MKPIVLLLIVAALYSCNSHADDWTMGDTVRQSILLGVTFIDYKQTTNIAEHPEKWHEISPILGSHPSRDKVNLYFLATAALQFGTAYILPVKIRELYQYGYIGYEAGFVDNNFRLGIQAKF